MRNRGTTYRMTVDLLENADGCQAESYGVSAESADGGRETVRCITMDEREIDSLIALLARNDVSPTALRDVVDDWLLR